MPRQFPTPGPANYAVGSTDFRYRQAPLRPYRLPSGNAVLTRLVQKFRPVRKAHTAYLDDVARELEVPHGKTLLQAALDAGIDFPHHCTVGTCGTCRCRLLDGKVQPILDFSYTLSKPEIDNGYILACQALLKSEIRIAVELGEVPTHPYADYAAVICDMRPLTPSIMEMTVELDRPMHYTAGQFADLRPHHLDRHRSYSFADACPLAGSTKLRFHVRQVSGGAFTDWLFGADRRGEALAVRGPSGNFWLRAASAPLICVAGGTGMAPILALLNHAAARRVRRPVTYLYGARTQADLYALADIKALQARWPTGFSFMPVLSEEPANSDWPGARGLVSDFLTSPTLANTVGSAHCYLCGPPAMIDSALAVLQTHGVSVEAIHYDKFLDTRQLAAVARDDCAYLTGRTA
jgi:p-cymene monooxygenase electron transfer component